MMPPNALFFNVPGHGHINPSLPLVAELVRRGHQITYFATESFRAKIEAAGAQFQPTPGLADDYFEAGGLDGSRPQKVAAALMKTTEQVLPELLEMARSSRPDYVLHDGMCPWGYWTGRALKLPTVASFALMPPFVPPLKDLLQGPMLRFLLSVMFKDLDKGLEATRRSRRLGKQYGVPPLGPATFLNAEGDISIAYTSPEYQPYADRVSKSVVFVGRTPQEEAGADPALFEPAGDRPIVYVSLGSVSPADRSLFEAFIRAFAGRALYVMLTTGRRLTPDSFGQLPENVSVHPWLPQIAVLKRASLFVSHGGLNSVHDGLYFGVPMLFCPLQGEQAFNAGQAVELGAGLMLDPVRLNQEDIRTQAERLLSEGSFKENARQIGETFRTAGGMPKAADEIEALIGRYCQ